MILPILLITLAPTHVLQVIDFLGYSRPIISDRIPTEYRGIVISSAKAQGIPVRILAKLIASESSWREWMISGPNNDGSYDYGIAGFNSRYVGWFCSKLGTFNPFVAGEAIPRAAKWLRIIYDEFGNWEDAVAAYKAGARRVIKGKEGWEVRAIAREVCR